MRCDTCLSYVLLFILPLSARVPLDGLNGDTRSVSATTSALGQALCIAGQHEEGAYRPMKGTAVLVCAVLCYYNC